MSVTSIVYYFKLLIAESIFFGLPLIQLTIAIASGRWHKHVFSWIHARNFTIPTTDLTMCSESPGQYCNFIWTTTLRICIEYRPFSHRFSKATIYCTSYLSRLILLQWILRWKNRVIVQVETSHRRHAENFHGNFSLKLDLFSNNRKKWGYLLSHWRKRCYLVYSCKCITQMMEAHILKLIAKFSIRQRVRESHSMNQKRNENNNKKKRSTTAAQHVNCICVCLCVSRQFVYYESECQIVYPLTFCTFHRITSHRIYECVLRLNMCVCCICFVSGQKYRIFWNPFVLISCSIHNNNCIAHHTDCKNERKKHTPNFFIQIVIG